jgi:hypothetical protein
MAVIFSPVGREYLGMARRFRERMCTESRIAAEGMKRIAAPAIEASNRRQGPLRPEALYEIERRWRALNPAGRLSLTIEHTDKTILVNETRLTSSDLLKPSFTGAEPGVMVLSMSLYQPKKRPGGRPSRS